MDWTAEPVPAASIPPSAPSGSRPPLPKLRVKLGGVQLSGGSSQRAPGSPHAADPNLPGASPCIEKAGWLDCHMLLARIRQEGQNVGSQARLQPGQQKSPGGLFTMNTQISSLFTHEIELLSGCLSELLEPGSAGVIWSGYTYLLRKSC